MRHVEASAAPFLHLFSPPVGPGTDRRCRSARQNCRLLLPFGQQQRPCKTVGPLRPCGAAVFVPIFTKNFRPLRHALPLRPAIRTIRDHAAPMMSAVSAYKFTVRRFSTSKRTRKKPACTTEFHRQSTRPPEPGGTPRCLRALGDRFQGA